MIDDKVYKQFARSLAENIRARAKGIDDESGRILGTRPQEHILFRPKDDPSKGASDDDPGNPTVDFQGEKRSNRTHRSTTDPDALLAKKSKGKRGQVKLRGARADRESQRHHRPPSRVR